jgi:cystathionine beta-lyase
MKLPMIYSGTSLQAAQTISRQRSTSTSCWQRNRDIEDKKGIDFMSHTAFDTLLIHGGIDGDKHTGAVTVPIYQTSTFQQDGLGELREGWEYSRTGNPTRAALESLIAQLEGGEAGFAFASGMAAITAVLSLFRSGDKILLSSNVYGGTFRVLDKVFSHFGLSYALEDTGNLVTLAEKFTPEVKAIIIESPANPLLSITDIRAVAELAHRHGVLVIVDNTFMTPYL